jgi:predicted anti-sigma-YlaC factor YlaD
MKRSMSCEVTQARLQDFLNGKLSAAERREVETHLEGCGDCAAWAALMGPDLLLDGAPDLADAVLERTSGSACSRAHEILCESVDGTLEDVDAELLGLHLDRCGACAALALALERLDRDLPAMAEIEPAAGFVEEVLAATLPRPSRWADLASRWSRGWAALLARPRIAWEAGYIGAVAVWLVVGVVGAPFQASPPLPSAENSAKIVDDVTQRVSAFGRRAWEATGGRGQQAWDGLQSDIARRYRHTESSRDALRRDGERLKQAALELDLEESGQALKALTSDARSVWDRFASAPEAADAVSE